MKNNLLTSVFAFLLCLSTLGSCVLLIIYNHAAHTVTDERVQLVRANQVLQIMQSLMNESVEYNKTAKNPDMTRILQPFIAGAPVAASAPATPAPRTAGKPTK